MTIARLALLLAAVSSAAVLAPFTAAAEGAPTVSGVEVTSQAGDDATYARGETIGVTLTFSEAVVVTGTPGLSIDMDPAYWGEKRAAYASGSGTAALVFTHQVVEPNLSRRGIAVLANSLALAGGTIRSASTQADAALGHVGLAHDADHKVDWRLSTDSGTARDTTPPRLVRGEIDGATMRLTFSEALDEGSTGGRFRVTVQRSRTSSRAFYATGDVTIDGAVVTVGLGEGNPRASAGLLTRNHALYVRRADDPTGGLRDLAGNPVRTPNVLLNDGNGWMCSERMDLVNVTAAAPVVTAPAVSGVEVTSQAGADATYALGETLEVTVTFSEAVTVTGTPGLSIDMDPAAWGEKRAAYASGSGTAALVFTHKVVEPNLSRRGIAVLANSLALAGGSIRSASSQADAALTHVGLAHDASHKVNWRLAPPDATAPRLSSTVVEGTKLKLGFNEAIDDDASVANGAFTVKKTPQGGTEESVGLSGTPAIEGPEVTLTLAKAVRSTDTDVKVSYRKSATDAGTRLRDESGNEVAGFSDEPVANAAADTTPPKLSMASVDGSALTLTFDETLAAASLANGAFAVKKTPQGGTEETVSLSGSPAISGAAVTLTLASAVAADDGAIKVSYTKPGSGGKLADAAGNEVASFADRAVTNATAPSVTEVEVVSDPGADDTYVAGDTVEVRVTFDAVVRVDTTGGTPRLKLGLGGDPAGERWAGYVSGSGTAALVFRYEVAAGDASSAGIAVLANTLEAKGGTLRSAAGADAALAHTGVAASTEHKVDTAAPTVESSGVEPAGPYVYLDFNEDMGEHLPAAGAFTVNVDGTDYTPTDGRNGDRLYRGVRWSRHPLLRDRRLIIYPGTWLYDHQTITVSYDKTQAGDEDMYSHLIRGDHTGPLRDVAGNELESFTDLGITNNSDTTAPTLESAWVDGTTLTLSYNEPVTCVASNTFGRPRWDCREESFDVTVDGEARSVTDARAEGRAVRLTLSSAVTVGQTATVSYDGWHPPSGWTWIRIRDLADNDAGNFSNQEVTNYTGLPAVTVADARAVEGTDATLDFAVTLDKASAGAVTVDYATADGTATAGADYTATSGTLTFAAGETAKTVSVPVLDDAIDEGSETFTLTLSNATGARIADGEATGTIANDDPLQKMWLSRFGRTVASHVTDAVSDRLSGPLTGAELSVGGQRVDLARTKDEAWLGQTLTSLARALGAREGPEPEGGGWPGTGLGVRESPAASRAPAREISGRELLLGSAFHLSAGGEGGGPGLAAWGRVTVGGFDGEAPADGGTVRIDGEVTTGILGADAEWDRLLAGVAVSLSEGEGAFDQTGVDSGTIESTMTTVSPYARLALTERVSAWGLLGYGTGDMTIVQAANERGQPERVSRSDLAMRLSALGGRGALLEAGEAGGLDLGLKADAFFVETESKAVSNEGSTTAEASRLRLILEGSRAFGLGGGVVLTPGLELGLRHDGGDAETGMGVELGGRIAWSDPGTGLGMEARVRTLLAHEDSDYREWGAIGHGASGPRRFGTGSFVPPRAHLGRGVERRGEAVVGARRGGARVGGRVRARGPPGRRARLRARPVRRPVHGHAEPRVRALGPGARVPHRLAADLGGAGRPRVRAQSRGHAPGER